MHKFFVAALAALTVAGAALTSAYAADPMAPVDAAADELPPIEPLPPEDAPLATGVYVRASGGHGFATDLDASQRKGSFARSRIDNAANVGGGVGLKLNAFFRTDLTLDHGFGSGFTGRYECAAPCGSGAPQRFRDRAALAATTAMLNGYLDIAEFGPVVPYVGAGLGASYLSLDDYRFRSAGPRGPRGRLADADAWNAAYALMAGIAFEISETVTVDVGYRFTALGDIRAAMSHGPARRGGIELSEIASHEVAIGLRYVFN